jgi:hypothetical protein
VARGLEGCGVSRDAGKIALAKLAAIDQALAELAAQEAKLLAERAQVNRQLSQGETVDPVTLKPRKRRHVPELPGPVSQLEQAMAQRELQKSDTRRRFGT